MIRKVTVDYNQRHPPGTLIISCSAKGKILYDRYQPNHKLVDKQKRPRQRGNANGTRKGYIGMYNSIITQKGAEVNAEG